MPEQRFGRVLRGQRGAAARTKYLSFLQGLAEQGEHIGTKGNRPPQKTLYIEPFAIPLGTAVKVKASALEPSFNFFASNGEYTSRATVTLGTNTPIKMTTYRPARVIRRQQSGTTGVAATSKLTGLKYLKYNTNSASVPFGRKGSTDTMAEAFKDIVQAAGGNTSNIKFSLMEEKV